jgi:hypothetical protein
MVEKNPTAGRIYEGGKILPASALVMNEGRSKAGAKTRPEHKQQWGKSSKSFAERTLRVLLSVVSSLKPQIGKKNMSPNGNRRFRDTTGFDASGELFGQSCESYKVVAECKKGRAKLLLSRIFAILAARQWARPPRDFQLCSSSGLSGFTIGMPPKPR